MIKSKLLILAIFLSCTSVAAEERIIVKLKSPSLRSYTDSREGILRSEILNTPECEELSHYQAMVVENTERDSLLRDLQQNENVVLAYQEFEPAPPPARKKKRSPKFHRRQRYLRDSPEGVAAFFANKQPGGSGENITIVDIEYGWSLNHEDLPVNKNTPRYSTRVPFMYTGHGTAVLGILVGKKNKFGVRGIAHLAQAKLAQPYTDDGYYSVATGILQAINMTSKGDIILLEQQLGGREEVDCQCGRSTCEKYLPVEIDPYVFDTIQCAVSLGRVVVEAAGNGGVSLDAEAFNDYFTGSNESSGAIMVGAVEPYSNRGYCYSGSGSRIDLSAWGSGVVTTGYGSLYRRKSRKKKERSYTNSFSGTSSASALIAGVAASIQGFAKAHGGVLSPEELKQLLMKTGTPADGASGDYGFVPNLKEAILTLKAQPEAFL